jgi:hypothetical protein
MNSRAKIAIVVGALVAGVAVLFVVGCGGSSSTNDVSVTTCRPAQPLVFPTPSGLPPGLEEYQSPERGYTVRYPADWQVKPNQASFQNISGDTFFSAAAVGDVRPNVTVTCEMIPVGTSSTGYLDLRRAVLQTTLNASPSAAASLQVDGKDAFAWHYKLVSPSTPEPLVVEKTEVLFADDRGGWTMALTVPEGQISVYEGVYDALVASFHEQ